MSLDDYMETPPQSHKITGKLVHRLYLKSASIPVKVGNRTVGRLVRVGGEKIYATFRGEDEIFVKFGGTIGISEELLIKLKLDGVTKVVILLADRKGRWLGKAYMADIDKWLIQGKSYWWKEGHEVQRHLKLEDMEEV